MYNRMKDHDVTWLYGPLQTGGMRQLQLDLTPPTSQVSRSNSFASKKPILKKRTLSEVMLQRSLSSSTLMKQATDALKAQQPELRGLYRSVVDDQMLSDFITSSEIGVPLSRSTTQPSTEASTASSGLQTPCTKRHIHFNDKVEQCIAIDKGALDRPNFFTAVHNDEDSSEDEMLIMKPVKQITKAKISSQRNAPHSSSGTDSKTIAMLPSTTLKYRADSPEPGTPQAKLKERAWLGGSKLSPSPSQQTLRPSPSSNFLLDDEDEDADMNWQPSTIAPRNEGLYPHGGYHVDAAEDGDDDEHSDLRRTSSGMFMPYEDEDDPGNTRILDRVLDTINTAKDIAHVIWNVGWHR